MKRKEALRLIYELEGGFLEDVNHEAIDVDLIQEELCKLYVMNQQLLNALREVVTVCDELQLKYMFVEEARAALNKARDEA